MDDLIRQLLGETTVSGDVAPAMTGGMGTVAPISNNDATGARRRVPPNVDPDRLRRMRSATTRALMGLKEDDDGSVIPSDAKTVSITDVANNGVPVEEPPLPGQTIAKPAGKEALISPTASLVAPDVTPQALYPIDPSKVPGADQGAAPSAVPPPARPVPPGANPPSQEPVVDLLLGKPAPKPGIPAQPNAAPNPPGGPPPTWQESGPTWRFPNPAADIEAAKASQLSGTINERSIIAAAGIVGEAAN